MTRRILAALPFDVRPGDVDRNRATALAGVEAAADAGAVLLALPEKWTTSFLDEYDAGMRRASEEALAQVHRAAAARGVTVVGSAPGGDGARPANEAHVLGAAGDLRPYRKRMLFSPTGEGRQVERGTTPAPTLDTPAGRIGIVICYDLRFPEVVRATFYAGADLLLCPAQWPHPRVETWELLCRARAAENQCWLLSCNRAGVAGLDGRHDMEFPGTALLVDPLGNVAARRDDGRLLVAEMDLEALAEVRRAVPVARDLRKAGLWPDDARTG